MIRPGIPGYSEEIRYDNTTTKVSSVATSISNKRVSTPTIVAQNIVAARVSTCKSCDKYKPNIDTCGMCGCGAIISQRASSIIGKCPSNKWPGESNAKSSN